MAARQQVKAPVGALGRALAREHADRILGLAAVRIDAAGIGIGARQVLGAEEVQQFAPVLEFRHRELRHAAVAHGLGVVLAAERLPAHLELIVVGARRGRARRPGLQQGQALGADAIERAVIAAPQRQQRRVAGALGHRRIAVAVKRRRQRRIGQVPERLVDGVREPRLVAGVLELLARAPPATGDLRQVAAAAAGNQRLARAEFDRAGIDRLAIERGPGELAYALALECGQQRAEQAVDAGVVEAAGDGRVHRDLAIRDARLVGVIAAPLLAHVAQRILGAALLELVEHHQLGVVEHVDLLELARRAVLGGHHVDRHVDEIGDLGVALADAGGLDQHQVEARVRVQLDDVL